MPVRAVGICRIFRFPNLTVFLHAHFLGGHWRRSFRFCWVFFHLGIEFSSCVFFFPFGCVYTQSKLMYDQIDE